MICDVRPGTLMMVTDTETMVLARMMMVLQHVISWPSGWTRCTGNWQNFCSFVHLALTPETKPVTVAVSQQQAVLTTRQHEPESQILIACENEQSVA